MSISPLTASDLSQIAPLQPDGWLPVLPYYEFYLGSDFCYPVKYTDGSNLAGAGTLIVHGETAWLAHIIVANEFRNRGIGTGITQYLIDLVKNFKAKTILLVATSLGERIYRNLGFQKETEYIFYKGGKTVTPPDRSIRAFSQEYAPAVLELDRHVSGEDREKLLLPHLQRAAVILRNNKLAGFFMPTLGEGLIAAHTIEAGLSLMKLKHSAGIPSMVPMDNRPAIQLLTDHGYHEFRRGTRMWLGERIHWHPENLFGRVGGNLG